MSTTEAADLARTILTDSGDEFVKLNVSIPVEREE